MPTVPGAEPSAGPAASQPEPPAEPGPIELSVLAEVKTLSAADRWPSLVATAVRLAKDLDDRRLATSHASLARQLRQVMADLHAASVGRKGKLVTVAALAQRPASGSV